MKIKGVLERLGKNNGKKKSKKKVEPLAEMMKDTEKLKQKKIRLGRKKVVYFLGLATAAFFIGLAVIILLLPVIKPNYDMSDIWIVIGIIATLFAGACIPLALKNNDIDNDLDNGQ